MNADTYLYPPRPTNAILPAMFGFFTTRGWIPQAKMNGTCSVIEIDDGAFHSMNRHCQEHKAWQGSKLVSDPLIKAFPKSRNVLVGELMHSKVPGMRDTMFLHDILVCRGHSLVGVTYQHRLEILADCLPVTKELRYWNAVTDNVLLAKPISLTSYFCLDSPFVEGIVLKDPNSVLTSCSKQLSNNSWSVKCRRSTANYSF